MSEANVKYIRPGQELWIRLEVSDAMARTIFPYVRVQAKTRLGIDLYTCVCIDGTISKEHVLYFASRFIASDEEVALARLKGI